MKNNSLRMVLEWVLICSLVFSCFFFIRFYFQSKGISALNRELQEENNKFQQITTVVRPLVEEAVEYSKSNPSIIPTLQAVGVLKPPTPPTAPPASPKLPGK
jgi:hypothetical protein